MAPVVFPDAAAHPLRAVLSVFFLVIITACEATQPVPKEFNLWPLDTAKPTVTAPTGLGGPLVVGAAARPTEVAAGPVPPPAPAVPAPDRPAPLRSGGPVEFAAAGMPLLAFINRMFGDILGVGYTVDPEVAARNQVVTLRSNGPKTPAELLELATSVLQSYGIEVIPTDGVYRIAPSGALLNRVPRLLRLRSQDDVPVEMRPVFQYVDIQRVNAGELRQWLTDAYGDKLRAIDLPSQNGLLLLGLPEDVQAAVEATRLLDQPRMAGRRSIRISPTYWSAEGLAEKLADVLAAEGYNTSFTASQPAAVLVLPMEAINQIIVMAADPELLDHVTQWARDLDRPASADPQRRLFYYEVKNTSAENLAAVLRQVYVHRSAAGSTEWSDREPDASPASFTMSQGRGAPLAAADRPAAGLPPSSHRGGVAQSPDFAAAEATDGAAFGAGAARPPGGGTAGDPRIIVDAARNALVFRGSAEEFEQIRTLIQVMDQPTREVMIEVTVAEVKLDDTSKLGIEWLLEASGFNGNSIRFGTLKTSEAGGLGLDNTGFNFQVLNHGQQIRAVLNALSVRNQARILSRPRLLARSGGEARIQVGREVPTVTSQSVGPLLQNNGTTQILQQIQYRNTGVILAIRPIIHGSRRVDLSILQEVSEPEPNLLADINSPLIATRRISTELSLSDGASVLIGGLISTNRTQEERGVPVLMDVPVLGQLFRANEAGQSRTELVVLITPYVINSDADAQRITDEFRRQLGPWAQPE